MEGSLVWIYDLQEHPRPESRSSSELFPSGDLSTGLPNLGVPRQRPICELLRQTQGGGIIKDRFVYAWIGLEANGRARLYCLTQHAIDLIQDRSPGCDVTLIGNTKNQGPDHQVRKQPGRPPDEESWKGSGASLQRTAILRIPAK